MSMISLSQYMYPVSVVFVRSCVCVSFVSVLYFLPYPPCFGSRNELYYILFFPFLSKSRNLNLFEDISDTENFHSNSKNVSLFIGAFGIARCQFGIYRFGITVVLHLPLPVHPLQFGSHIQTAVFEYLT